jgi:hypothetical protein
MRYVVIGLLLALSCTALAQQPDSKQPDAQQIVTREFGKSFTLAAGFAPMLVDIDNDGAEDMVAVVMSNTPLVDENELHYRAVDPYDKYWGYGDPHDTIRFSATDVGPTLFIAIIHDWKAPKAKFLVVNLPFKKLTLSRVQLKKRAINSLHAVEEGGLESDMFWDGKKYKWEPGYIGQ